MDECQSVTAMKRAMGICQQVEAEHRYAPPAKRNYVVDGRDPVTKPVCLSYEVFKWSSYSPGYHPRNITVDAPQDVASRWMAWSNVPPQYIVLKLEQPAILHTIEFCKTKSIHNCQLRYAKVYGGMREDQVVELGSMHLSEEPHPEQFSLLPDDDDSMAALQRCVPCQYVKIVPLQNHNNKFNFTIWHVKLLGISAPSIVVPARDRLEKYLDDEAMRLCMKYLRECSHLDVLQVLNARSDSPLEDAWLTTFHHCLVKEEDFSKAERLVSEAAVDGMFDKYISQATGKLKWTPINPVASRGETTRDFFCWPSGRSGHAMCGDSERGSIYVSGGWDGRTELGDLWRFDTESSTWECLSANVEADGGPSPRSCHRICVDPERQQLYVLGRFYGVVDRITKERIEAVRTLGLRYNGENADSDFYRYDIVSREWTKVSLNTAVDGGPPCLYDHQMCFDSENRRIFVFGGRYRCEIDPKAGTTAVSYSGLYSYDVETGVWKQHREGGDGSTDSPAERSTTDLASRVCHGMVTAPAAGGQSRLFVFGGQRHDLPDPMASLQCYNPDTDTVDTLDPIRSVVTVNSHEGRNPTLFHNALSSGCLHCIYDPERHEIRVAPSVLGGDALPASPPTHSKRMHNFLWSFSLSDLRWEWLLDVHDPGPCLDSEALPKPRSMFGFVYDVKSKAHYVFGGRDYVVTHERLDDLWKLTIERPNRQDLLHRAIFDLRKLRCLHLAVSDIASAIRYIQTEMASFVKQGDAEEVAELHDLCNEVFQVAHDYRFSSASSATRSHLQRQRNKLFEQISSYFPRQKAGPRASLRDVLVIDKAILSKSG